MESMFVIGASIKTPQYFGMLKVVRIGTLIALIGRARA